MNRTRRSDVIKRGRTRAPHRAFMHAMGLTDEDISKPFVAVMGPYGELTPCNLHIGALMKTVKTGIAEAGGIGRESGMAMVADSLSMNHQGMKFSLITREVMADSIEAVVRGPFFAALAGIARCGQRLPRVFMGMVCC